MALITRLLCSLALILATAPIRAGAPSCAPASPAPVASSCCSTKMAAAVCPMHAAAKASCCEGHAGPVVGEKVSHAVAPADQDVCRCELRSAPPMPAADVKATVEAPAKAPLIAVLPPAPVVVVDAMVRFEPGIVGLDSGPPVSGVRRPNYGRAPPAR